MFQTALIDAVLTGVHSLAWLFLSRTPSRGLIVLVHILFLCMRLSALFWFALLSPEFVGDFMNRNRIPDAFVVICQVSTFILSRYGERRLESAIADPRLVALQIMVHSHGFRIRKFFDKKIGLIFSLLKSSSDLCPICLDTLSWRQTTIHLSAKRSSNYRGTLSAAKTRGGLKCLRTSCCRRVFHYACIETWLASTNEQLVDPSCPICRQSLQVIEDVEFNLF